MSIFVFVSFSTVNGILFRRHFPLRAKIKNAFRSASSIHHKQVLVLVLVLVLRCKVLVLVLNTRLGLGLGLERILSFGLGLGFGLEIKVLLLILVFKNGLDYITAKIGGRSNNARRLKVRKCGVCFSGRMPPGGKLSILNLLTGQKSGFSPRGGDSTDSGQTRQSRRASGSA